MKKSKIWKVSKDELQALLNESESFAQVLRKLDLPPYNGGCNRTLKERINTDNLSTDKLKENRKKFLVNHFAKIRNTQIDYSLIFCENSSYADRAKIKELMVIKYRIEYQCSECKITNQYNGKPLSLQLDHINGVNNDNRLENLRFLCPNCHSQTTTFSGKKHKKIKPFCEKIYKTKIKWPSKDALSKLVWEQTLESLAIQLKVTGNAIKARCQKEKIECPPKGYWTRRSAGYSHEESLISQTKSVTPRKKFTSEDLISIKAFKDQGKSNREIADIYKVAHTTISRLLKNNGAK